MKRVLTILSVLACAGLLLFSCKKEEGAPRVAKAVLGSVSLMNFEAENPVPQTLTVVSDGPWHVTAPDWITVDPSTGTGETQVTVTAAANTDDEGQMAPRKDKVIISGDKLSSRLIITVNQAGDAYRNAEHLTLTQIAALEDGKSFILDEATVVALSTTGFVVTDGTVNMYMKSDTELSVGNKVSVKGLKATENGVPVVGQVDGCTVKSTEPYEYPAPLDITDQIATYAATSMEYVTVNGMVSSGNLVVTVDEKEYSIKPVDCPEDLSLSSLTGHKVILTGYSFGVLGERLIGLVVTDVKDKGLNKRIFFEDNFDWFKDLADKAGAGDGVGKQESGATAPNVYTFDTDGSAAFFKLFDEIGYEDLNPSGKVMYMQKYYLKFSKGKVVGGLRLPKMEFGATPVDVVLEFDWCAQMGGTGAVDAVSLNVELTGAGNCGDTGQAKSNAIAHKQETGQMFWQHVKLSLEGVTDATRIEIKPTQFGATAGYYRFFLDNIKVAESDPEPLAAGTTVFEDDFEWLEPYSSAVNAPDDIKTDKVNSTKNIFTTAAVQGILTDLQTKGYGYIWGGKGMTEWSSATPTTGDGQTLYLLKNYLKFGKTDWSSGLVLPALKALKVSQDVEITFDWCFCKTGSNNPDLMTLTAESSDGATVEFTSSQPAEAGKCQLVWQHAKATFTGANADTRITLRPTNVDPYVSNKDRGQNRWYLDNIKIVVK